MNTNTLDIVNIANNVAVHNNSHSSAFAVPGLIRAYACYMNTAGGYQNLETTELKSQTGADFG